VSVTRFSFSVLAPTCLTLIFELSACYLRYFVCLFNLTTLSKIMGYAALNFGMVINDKVWRTWKGNTLSISACTKRNVGKPWITSVKVFYRKDGGYKFLQSAGNHLSGYGVTPLKNAVIVFPILRTSNLIQSNQESITLKGGAHWIRNRSFNSFAKTFGQ
jgi:hypothetical protein